jgi:hypothetical protein
MPDTIDLILDTREMDAALKALPAKLAERAMRAALHAAGDVMLDAVVAHTPERTDEEMPNSDSLPPGILKADMHTEVLVGGSYAPRVKVGPSKIAGHVARWQNNGYTLTSHGRSKSGRRAIRAIAGQHFLEAGFDESAETAVNMFCATLGDELFGAGAELENARPNDNSFDVEFD